MSENEERDPLEAGLSAAFDKADGPQSVLTILQQKTGEAPHVSLREEDSAIGGASPMIDARSTEKLALPQGRGNYQLMGEIARGGMGVVLKGHDADLGRDVALKVLHKDLSDKPEILQRFVEEAQIGGQLQHPGIVPVYELGLMADDRPYFTMKLVKGRTLATLLAEREEVTDDRRHLLDTFLAVCQTIAYAHSRGVIHRDLKPANIMVGAFGEVQVVDWGLAKVLAHGGTADEKKAKEQRSMHTVLETVRSGGTSIGSGSGSDSMVGSVMGTPAYMPPEQAAGMVDKLDERADVFALGAILCEILTGKPPYDGEAEKTLIQAAQAELEDALGRLDGCDADAELVKLTKQCLMPSAATRPRNAGVLADKLRGHLESVEERARQLQIEAAEAQVHAQNERKARNLILALAASVVTMVGLGGGGWIWVQNERAVRREEAAAAELERAQRERDIDSGVSVALSEASGQQERRQWNEAYASLERGRVLAGTAESPERWLQQIDAQAAAIEEAHAAARFVDSLEEVEQGVPSLLDWKGIDQEYAQKFIEFGIDVDGSSAEEVVAALGERGIGIEVVSKLDRWLVVRRNYQQQAARDEERTEDKEPSLHLVDIAHGLDDDPMRADLREAWMNDDLEMLRLLAADDLSEQPPSTLGLLGTALALAGERDEGLTVFRDGVRQHPDDYELRTSLVTTLLQNPLFPVWDREECQEALGHSEAALALRPDNLSHRSNRFWQLLGLAWDAERDGRMERARYLFALTAKAVDNLHRGWDPPRNQLLWRGWAYEGAGEMEQALEAYRTMARNQPDFETSYGRTRQEWEHWYMTRAATPLLRGGALEDAIAALEPTLQIDYGPAFGDWVVAHALLHAREGDATAAAQVLRAGPEESHLERAASLNRIAWSFARVPRSTWLVACHATTPEAIARVEPALDAMLAELLAMSEESIGIAESSVNLNTLGILRYRAGDLEGARETLERAAAARGGGDAHDFYFLAMVHHGLGEPETARAYYDRAFAGTVAQPVSTRKADALGELLVFRDEADAVLGIERGE